MKIIGTALVLMILHKRSGLIPASTTLADPGLGLCMFNDLFNIYNILTRICFSVAMKSDSIRTVLPSTRRPLSRGWSTVLTRRLASHSSFVYVYGLICYNFNSASALITSLVLGTLLTPPRTLRKLTLLTVDGTRLSADYSLLMANVRPSHLCSITFNHDILINLSIYSLSRWPLARCDRLIWLPHPPEHRRSTYRR